MVSLRADIGIRFLPAEKSFLSPPVNLVHQFWGELDQVASFGLFQANGEQRPHVLQTIALVEEAARIANPACRYIGIRYAYKHGEATSTSRRFEEVPHVS